MTTQTKNHAQRFEWILKAAAGLTALGLLTSCSPDLSSSASNSTTSASTSVDGAGAECTSFNVGASLAGKLTTYYAGNALQTDRVRLRLTGLDGRFTATSTTYIQFFRWTSNSNGVSQLDSTPLTFAIEKGTTNTQAITNGMNALDFATLSQIRMSAGVTGTTAQDFFNNSVFVITGLDSSWAALKVVLYDGSTTLAQADALLPVFAANPNTYAQHYPPVLSNLHPLNTLRGSTMADAEWLARSKMNCF